MQTFIKLFAIGACTVIGLVLAIAYALATAPGVDAPAVAVAGNQDESMRQGAAVQLPVATNGHMLQSVVPFRNAKPMPRNSEQHSSQRGSLDWPNHSNEAVRQVSDEATVHHIPNDLRSKDADYATACRKPDWRRS